MHNILDRFFHIYGGPYESIDDNEVRILFDEGFKNFLFVFILLVIIACIYKKLNRETKKKIWSFVDSYLKWYIIIVWILGFITYFTGQYVGYGTFFNTVPMAIIHATGMFLGLSDISEIRDSQHNNAFYMAWFNVSHILAVLGSFLFIIRQFGYFIESSLRIYIESHWPRRCKDLFVFWGINNASFALAQSIRKSLDPKDYRIVFVRTFDDSDKENEQFNFGQIFDKIKTKRQDLERLRDFECFSTASFHSLSELDCQEGESIIREKMGLKSLARLMQSDKTEKTHIFLFSDNENDNIAVATNLIKGEDVKKNDVQIYCHALKSKTTEWMEFYDITKTEERTQISLIDSAMLSVSELRKGVGKKSEDLPTDQPVSFVKINPDATVDDKFEALIIGFGQTGHEAFKFLYEFSAFVGSDGKRSPFAIHVIDRNMDKLLGDFKMQAPDLKKYLVKEGESKKDEKYVLDFKKQSFADESFWGDVEKYIENLRYVVIAIDDNDMEFELAMNIYQFAMRQPKHHPSLKIYLRCNSSVETLQFDKAIEFANKRIGLSNKEKGAESVIIPFGKMEDIFKYDIIVADKLRDEAIAFYNSYRNTPLALTEVFDVVVKDEEGNKIDFGKDENKNRSLEGLKFYTKEVKKEEEKEVKIEKLVNDPSSLISMFKSYKNSTEGAWKIRRTGKFNPIPDPKTGKLSPKAEKDYYEILNLERKEFQDRANALHIQTKMKLFQYAAAQNNLPFVYNEEHLSNLGNMTCSGYMKDAKNISNVQYKAPNGYDEDDEVALNVILTNLAKTEHCRWVASHQLLGYKNDDTATGSDAKMRTHNCMVDWDMLQEVSTRSWEASWHTDYLLADYKTVITTFRVELENLKKRNKQKAKENASTSK